MADNVSDLMHLTAGIVAAYVSNNSVQKEQMQELIGATYTALQNAGQPPKPEVEKPTPAVSIKKSITPDYLISLEDGKRYKTLKRHLAGRDLTPAAYRSKWGLSADYPMVAQSYAARRSELAKSLGLGRKLADTGAAAATPKQTRRRKAKASNAPAA